MNIKCDLSPRVETGAIQFEYNNGYKDWKGLFIRGDEAFNLVLQIESLLASLTDQQKEEQCFAVNDLKCIAQLIKKDVIS